MASDLKPAQKTIIEIAEQAGKITAVVAALLLTMSVCYDYSFLTALDLSFNEIPSSTAEHVRSALLWIPSLILVFVGMGILEIRSRLKNSDDEAQIGDGRLTMRNVMFATRKDRIVVMSLAFFVATSAFLSMDASWAFYAFMYSWCLIAVFIATHERLRPLFNRPGRLLFFCLPLLLAIVGNFGYSSGTRLLQGGPKWDLTIRIGTVTSKQTLVGIRRFSTFAVTVDEKRNISIIPNDAILSASLITKQQPPILNSCRWFNLKCDQQQKKLNKE
jgi:hypothetical protein